MGNAILRPAVVDFLEIAHPRVGGEVDMEELRIRAGSSYVGFTIRELEQSTTRVRVVALKRGDESIELVPDESTQIDAEDHLVLIGERDSLAKLAEQAGG